MGDRSQRPDVRLQTRVEAAGRLRQPVGVTVHSSERLDEQAGDEVERVDDGQCSKQPAGDEVERVDDGQCSEQPAGDKVERVDDGQSSEQPAGDEVESVDDGECSEQPAGDEVERVDDGQGSEQPAGGVFRVVVAAQYDERQSVSHETHHTQRSDHVDVDRHLEDAVGKWCYGGAVTSGSMGDAGRREKTDTDVFSHRHPIIGDARGQVEQR